MMGEDSVATRKTILSCEWLPLPATAGQTGAFMTKTDFHRVYEHAIDLLPQLAARSTSAIYGWLDAGCDPEKDINPTIERLATKNPSIGGFSYFTNAILKAKDERLACNRALKKVEERGEDADLSKARKIALTWRKYGIRRPENERWLLEYEAKHGKVEV